MFNVPNMLSVNGLYELSQKRLKFMFLKKKKIENAESSKVAIFWLNLVPQSSFFTQT